MEKLYLAIFLIFYTVSAVATVSLKSSNSVQEQFERSIYNEIDYSQSTDHPFLEASPSFLYFDGAKLYVPMSKSLTLTNKSAEEVYVEPQLQEGTWVEVPEAIAPGDSVSVQVFFTPSRQGAFFSTLVFRTSSGDLCVKISGEVLKNVLEFKAPAIYNSAKYFGRAIVRARNPFRYPVTVKQVFSNEARLHIKLKEFKIAPQNMAEICDLTSSQTHPGVYKYTLHIRTDIENVDLPVTVNVNKKGVMIPHDLRYILTQRNLKYLIPIVVTNLEQRIINAIDPIIPAQISSIATNRYNEFIGWVLETFTTENAININSKLALSETLVNVKFEVFELLKYVYFKEPVHELPLGPQSQEVFMVNNSTYILWIEQILCLCENTKIRISFNIGIKPGGFNKIFTFETAFTGGEEGTIIVVTNIGKFLYPVYARTSHLQVLARQPLINGHLDLGTVAASEEQTHSVTLHNRGPYPEVLQNVHSECVTALTLVAQNDYQRKVTFKTRSLAVPLARPFLELPVESATEFELRFDPDLCPAPQLRFSNGEEEAAVHFRMQPIAGRLYAHPIDLQRGFPGIAIEKQLVLTNAYSQAINIKRITANSPYLAIKVLTDTVAPQRTIPVASVTVRLPKKDLKQDFSKLVTVNEFNTWSGLQQIKRHFSEIISIQTDLVKEVQSKVHLHVEKPQFIAKRSIEFLPTQANTRQAVRVPVRNPSDFPVKVQLLLLNDSTLATIKLNNCPARVTPVESIDTDEFENVEPASSIECMPKPFEEIAAISQASRAQVPPLVKKPPNNDLLTKLQCAFFAGEGEIYYFQPRHLRDVVCSAASKFYLQDTQPVVIPPHSEGEVGPVFFHAGSEGTYTSTLILRNNITIIEEISLRAQSLVPKLVFMDEFGNTNLGTLNFEVSSTKALLLSYSSKDPLFKRTFRLKNSSDLTINVQGLSLEGQYCEFNGFGLPDCLESFSLGPYEQREIEITFSTDFSSLQASSKLWLGTDSDLFYIDLEAKLSDLNSDIFALNFFFFYRNSTLSIVAISLLSAVAIVVTVTYTSNKQQLSPKLQSSKESSVVAPRVLVIRKYTQPMFKPKNTEQAIVSTPKEETKVEEEVKVNETKRKKNKVRKVVNNPTVQKVEHLATTKNKPTPLPQVIATNVLLKKKPRKKKSIEEAPAPRPVEQKEITTEEEDEDFFIDAYKQNNALFNFVMPDQCFSALDELKKESEDK